MSSFRHNAFRSILHHRLKKIQSETENMEWPCKCKFCSEVCFSSAFDVKDTCSELFLAKVEANVVNVLGSSESEAYFEVTRLGIK